MAVLSDKGISYTAGFFMLIAFAVGGMMIGSIISMPILLMKGGGIEGITRLNELMGDPRYFREMQLIQTISAICGFLAPTIFAAYLLSKRPMKLTGFKGRITPLQIVLTVLIIGCGVLLSGSLGYLSYQIPFPQWMKTIFQKMESDYAEMAANLINLDNPLELAISIVVLAFIPAVCEEALFRGGLQNYMYRSTRKLWLSVIVVSLIFSAVHFSAFGFLSRFALGIILGLLFQFSGRLWLPILAHFINNAAAVVVMYVQRSGGKSLAEIMSDKEGSYMGLLTIPVIIFLFIKFKQASPKGREEEPDTLNTTQGFSFENKTADGF